MVSVSTNGQQFTNTRSFTYYDVPVVSTVSPNSGPIAGDTLVSVTGSGLSGGSAYRCRFANSEVVATFEASPLEVVMCRSAISLRGA